MYREVTLKGKITDAQGSVRLLRDEKVFDQIDGVFHLSGDEGIIGTLYITNIRLLWHSALDSSMNSSIPYLETTHIQLKDSKYGKTLTLDAKAKIRQFYFGFRIDPPQKMVRACQEIKNLWKLYHERPIFGVNVESTDSDVRIRDVL
jgi:Bardet-Biedl syndrome 5 protein